MSITRIQDSVFMSTPVDMKKRVIVKGNFTESFSPVQETFLETMNHFQKRYEEPARELEEKEKEQETRNEQWEIMNELFRGYYDKVLGTHIDSST